MVIDRLKNQFVDNLVKHYYRCYKHDDLIELIFGQTDVQSASLFEDALTDTIDTSFWLCLMTDKTKELCYQASENFKWNWITAYTTMHNFDSSSLEFTTFVEEHLKTQIQQITSHVIKLIIDVTNKIKLIQRQWRKSISDPKYKICQKRLMTEYQELGRTLK